MFTIDRCYCEQKTFETLLEIAQRDALDLRQLSQQEGCGIHCGWCVAYLRRTLHSGQTDFHETFPKEEIDSLMES
ncbi:MAG: (2Fe-2S)-binding protein [Chloroflexota bacterium]